MGGRLGRWRMLGMRRHIRVFRELPQVYRPYLRGGISFDELTFGRGMAPHWIRSSCGSSVGPASHVAGAGDAQVPYGFGLGAKGVAVAARHADVVMCAGRDP